MRQLAVLVELLIKETFAAHFGELIAANAEASLKDEEGCRRFDVLVDSDEPRRFVLYEIYDDERAFDLHLRTPHYQRFAKGIEGFVEERSVRRFSFFDQVSGPDD
ncbi:MAG: antibiotic biosynthesis monooxygenase [Acidobacteria bacterium]|nr:antibiotic biosynthesis monooxygenase [Acidobacteriota bacterium]